MGIIQETFHKHYSVAPAAGTLADYLVVAAKRAGEKLGSGLRDFTQKLSSAELYGHVAAEAKFLNEPGLSPREKTEASVRLAEGIRETITRMDQVDGESKLSEPETPRLSTLVQALGIKDYLAFKKTEEFATKLLDRPITDIARAIDAICKEPEVVAVPQVQQAPAFVVPANI